MIQKDSPSGQYTCWQPASRLRRTGNGTGTGNDGTGNGNGNGNDGAGNGFHAGCKPVVQRRALRLLPRLALAATLLIQIFLQTACARTQSASVALSGAAIDAFFIPLLQDGVSAATLPADPPAPATVVSSVMNQISNTPIVIRRVMPPPVHELREKYEVAVLLWPGADIDGGGADLWVGGPQPLKTTLETPWEAPPSSSEILPVRMVVDENDGSDQSAIFTATISYPLNRAFTLPLEQISGITMVCAACLNSDLSRLTGTGRVYLAFGGLLSGGIDQMILSGTDDAGTDTKVSGSLLFADADIDTAVALSSDVTFNLDFGDGDVGFNGSLALWQPADKAVAGIAIGSADDYFAGLGSVVLYFSPR